MKHGVIGKLAIPLFVFFTVQSSFVEPAPTAKGNEGVNSSVPKVDLDEVKQLEHLKQSPDKSFAVLESHTSVLFTDSEGHETSHTKTTQEALRDHKLEALVSQDVTRSRDGKNATPAAKVHTEVAIPSRGVHRVVDQQLDHGQREIPFNFERRSPTKHTITEETRFPEPPGIQYSPRDMAEYIFWTGDEKGVTLAIEEFLAEGLMTREEAISFLQDIKINLDYLQLRYSDQQRFHKPDETDFINVAGTEKSFGVVNSPNNLPEPNYVYETQKRFPSELSALQNVEAPAPSLGVGISEDDYEELLDRLRVADFLYTEYSLEEVIYQLAKVMFSQSLSKGSSDAQEALQKFTTFLEAEAEKGRISKSLEKKVLDVLIASLSDTLTEHPQLLPTAQETLKETSHATASQLLHQLMWLNPAAAPAAANLNVKAAANKLRPLSAFQSHQSTLAKGPATLNAANGKMSNEPAQAGLLTKPV